VIIDDPKDEIVYGTFFQVEIPGEGIANFPTTEYSEDEVLAITEIDEINEVEGYFCEVLDDTGFPQWIGPFDSEDELIDHLSDLGL
jgi:hypothetical protein